MNILIDNKDLYSHFGIKCLDWTQALSIANERDDIQTWYNKSGIDKNLEHNRYDAREFTIECYTKQLNLETAYLCFKNFAEYLHNQRVVVFSLHSSDMRQAFLVERSVAITPEINIRQQNSLYYAKIGFRDINPNALVYYKEISVVELGTTTLSINYDKGTSANVYWGNGDQGEVSNSSTYSHIIPISTISSERIDIIVDVDKDLNASTSLVADFILDFQSGISSHEVQFTSTSQGSPTIYRWDFGDNEVSSEQNPKHTFVNAGSYTVKLTIYNAKNTQASKTVEACVVVRKPRLLFSDGNYNIIHSTPTNYIVTHQ